jgi:hypothetical protein
VWFSSFFVVIGCGKIFSVSSDQAKGEHQAIIDKLYAAIKDKDQQV